MKPKQRYFYILKFAKEPLVKIGIGTKGGNLNYERIKQHQSVYGEVFDLKNSYELSAPAFYSITALERSIKDYTYSYIPPKDVMAKYLGKDGYTEIRTLSSLDSILKYIELQTLNVDLKLVQGIDLEKYKKEDISTKINQLVDTEKKKTSKNSKFYEAPVVFPFTYLNQKHKIELVLYYNYIPNLNKIIIWSFDELRGAKLRIDCSKDFLKDIYLNFESWLIDESKPYKRLNEVNYGLYQSVWLKHITIFDKNNGKRLNSIMLYSSTWIADSDDRFVVEFSISRIDKSSDLYREYLIWLKKHFIEPLEEKISHCRVSEIVM